jgi:hypothetical protein
MTMRCAQILTLLLALCLGACNRPPDDSAKSPLPTRQTTIDPVNAKLDAAAKEMERRRQDIDNSAK